MKILVLDNYDSFTYNLVQYAEEVTGSCPDVFRNDKITVGKASHYDKILLSPGPGLPAGSGILCDLVRALAPAKSILGVCLGLQAIGEVFGAKLKNLPQVFHGVATAVHVRKTDDILFNGVPEIFTAGRYHSWVVSRENLPSCFDLTCEDSEGHVMGLTHRRYDVRGVQFHPESVMTEFGRQMIKNWIEN